MRNVAVCPRISSFSSRALLVSVQLSVSSSWRFAHRAKIARNASSVAMATRIRGRRLRRLEGSGAGGSAGAPATSTLIRPPKYGRASRAMPPAGVLAKARHPRQVGCTPHRETPAGVLVPRGPPPHALWNDQRAGTTRDRSSARVAGGTAPRGGGGGGGGGAPRAPGG